MVTFSPDISGVYKVRLGATPAAVDVGMVGVGDGVVGDDGLEVGDVGMTEVGDVAFDVAAGAEVDVGDTRVAVGTGLVVVGGMVTFFAAHADGATTAAATTTVRASINVALGKAIISVPSVSTVADLRTGWSKIYSMTIRKPSPDSRIIRRLLTPHKCSLLTYSERLPQSPAEFSRTQEYPIVSGAEYSRLTS
jgi:hypothetical protein